MVIIPNQKLIKTLDKTIPYQKSLEIVNDVLYRGVQVREREPVCCDWQLTASSAFQI